MYSLEGLLDLENEKYVVSVFYLGRPQPLLLYFISECLSTGDKLQLLSLGPIYLLPQNFNIFANLKGEKNGI